MADERGAFGGGQPGEWTPSAGPNPGAGWAPIGGTQGRAYSPYYISTSQLGGGREIVIFTEKSDFL